VVNTEDLPVTEAWQRASDSDADLDLDYNSLNPHFQYIDEDSNQRHVVWFLDGVTCSMSCALRVRSACRHSHSGALARKTTHSGMSGTSPQSDSLQALGTVQPGHDVDNEGDGDILRVTGLPQPGKRTVNIDTDETDPRKKLIIDEHMDVYPAPTPWNTTATMRTRLRSHSTTVPTPSGPQRSSTS